jgi:hypothetical protein
LANATCFINSGGNLMTAGNQTKCKEGDEITINYNKMSPDDGNVFIVSYAEYIEKFIPVYTTPNTT